MKLTNVLFGMSRIFVVCLLAVVCGSPVFSAQVETFKDGLTNPTGLAINTISRQLYVNCGTNGNLWTIDIKSDGTAGSIELITSGFTPKMDLALDAEMNAYGAEHGSINIYRVDTRGNVSSLRGDRYDLDGSIAIEPMGL